MKPRLKNDKNDDDDDDDDDDDQYDVIWGRCLP